MTSKKLSVLAKALPRDMRTDEELHQWLAGEGLSLGGIEKIPRPWHESLSRLPRGYVALSNGSCGRMMRCKAKKGFKPFVFDGRRVMHAGQMVILVRQAA